MSAVCPICGKSLDGFRERCPECVGLVPQGRGAIPPRRKSNGIGGIVAVGVGVLVLLLLGLGGLVIIAVFALGRIVGARGTAPRRAARRPWGLRPIAPHLCGGLARWS